MPLYQLYCITAHYREYVRSFPSFQVILSR